MTKKRAVITGGSSGIGKATALALARKGFTVALSYASSAQRCQQVVAEIEGCGGRAIAFQMDMIDPAASAKTIDEVVDKLGGIDVFVNNAGVNRRASILEETLEDWQRVLTINATAPFLCAQVAARRMVSQGNGGRIINVTSVHEMTPILGGAAYCASKGALGLLTKVMALELAQHGITVNAVSPGETATPMNGVPEDMDAGSISRPKIPITRPGRASEVAGLIAYLAEPTAEYITGTSIVIDGGLSLMSAIPNQEFAQSL